MSRMTIDVSTPESRKRIRPDRWEEFDVEHRFIDGALYVHLEQLCEGLSKPWPTVAEDLRSSMAGLSDDDD